MARGGAHGRGGAAADDPRPDPRDLPSCAWTGSSKSNFAAALDRADRGEVDYLVVCPPSGLPLAVGDVDFSGERWEGVLEPLNDPEFFGQVTVNVEAGTVMWPNGIDLAPEPRYGQAHAHPLVAA